MPPSPSLFYRALASPTRYAPYPHLLRSLSPAAVTEVEVASSCESLLACCCLWLFCLLACLLAPSAQRAGRGKWLGSELKINAARKLQSKVRWGIDSPIHFQAQPIVGVLASLLSSALAALAEMLESKCLSQ
jgi:hypothetical protein